MGNKEGNMEWYNGPQGVDPWTNVISIEWTPTSSLWNDRKGFIPGYMTRHGGEQRLDGMCQNFDTKSPKFQSSRSLDLLERSRFETVIARLDEGYKFTR
jgi:hypothetical protein